MAGTTSLRAPDGSFFRIPPFGLSTAGMSADEARAAVKYAIVRANYRLLYVEGPEEVEAAVGDALAEILGDPTYGIYRDDLFLIGSLWPTDYGPGLPRRACERSLAALRVARFDLFVAAWPVALRAGHGREPKPGTSRCACCNQFTTDSIVPLSDVWRACEALVDAGLARAVGLANVAPEHVRAVLDGGRLAPSAVLAERTPYLPQRELLALCRRAGVVPVALGPLGAPAGPGPRLLDEPAVAAAAAAGGVPPALAVLAHAHQTEPDVPLLVAAHEPDAIRSAIECLRVPPLPAEAAAALSALSGRPHRFASPPWAGLDDCDEQPFAALRREAAAARPADGGRAQSGGG